MSSDKVATLRYGNDEVTVLWRPSLCIHSGICARGLPQVFDPKKRPWIAVDGATAAEIVEQVARCPSGALAIEELRKPSDQARATKETK
jgi:uncharacterized Fe-S cluster protein YjdI